MTRDHCKRVLAALAVDDSAIGMSRNDVAAALGLTPVQASAALLILRHAGKVHALGTKMRPRFFATAKRAEQCRSALDAHIAQRLNAQADRRRELTNARCRAAWKRDHPGCAPRGARPPKKPKAAKSVNVGGLIVRQPALKSGVEIKKPREVLPVIVPAHVRVQVCPCGKDTRYQVPADHVGEWTREWREKRA